MIVVYLSIFLAVFASLNSKVITVDTFEGVADIDPKSYIGFFISNVDDITLTIYDPCGFYVTVHLNEEKTDLTCPSPIIRCEKVRKCTVVNLSLTSNSYYLTISNTYNFSQRVVYEIKHQSFHRDLRTQTMITMISLSFTWLCYATQRLWIIGIH